MNVATIMITWNQMSLTLGCLASLREAGVPMETIWVVDNGSVPSAAPAIHAQFPQVHIVRLAENRGFAGGANAGIAAALEAGCDALFLLNNDAVVERHTLSALVAALERDSRIAAVAPKVYYDNTPRVFQSVGVAVDPNSGRVSMLGNTEPDRGQYDQVAEREALFGCALLIRRAAWEEVGGFWEPFFSYAEETDWCLRARKRGWRLCYVPEAVVWHKTSTSLGHDSPLKIYLITRNLLYLRQRHHYGGWRAWLGLASSAYWNTRTWASFLRRGMRAQARALLLGWWDFLHGRTGNSRTAEMRVRPPQ